MGGGLQRRLARGQGVGFNYQTAQRDPTGNMVFGPYNPAWEAYYNTPAQTGLSTAPAAEPQPDLAGLTDDPEAAAGIMAVRRSFEK